MQPLHLYTGEFTIDTKLAGIGTLLLRVHGIRDSFKIEAHPVSIEKPRLLAASYHPAVSGEYTIFVRWSGVHVPGSPFTILIREGKLFSYSLATVHLNYISSKRYSNYN